MQAYATPATGSAPQLRLVDGSSVPATALPIGHGGDVLQQLLGQLVELVAERVAARLAAPEREPADQWLDTRRAAAYLGIGRDSIRRLAAEGSIPTEQAGLGCKLYFRRSDLDRWRSSATGPIEPLRGRRHG
jgi:excisionase family DNA binding protein